MENKETAPTATAPGIGTRLKTWWLGHPGVIRLYLGGIGCSLIAIALMITGPKSLATNVAFYAAFTLLAIAFLREIYIWVLPKLELPLVKLAIAAVGVMAAAAATGISRMTVSDATGQAPEQFSTTIALLVPLSFISVLALITSTVGVVILSLAMIWAFAKVGITKSSIVELDMVLMIARIVAGIVVVVGAASLLSPSSFFNPSMKWVAGYSAYLFDLQPDPSCAPTDGDRVARINDDLVIIGRATDDGLQFVRKACAIAAEGSELRPPRKIQASPKAPPG
jgi:hypothetical protein